MKPVWSAQLLGNPRELGRVAVVFNVGDTDVEESDDEPPSRVADEEVIEVAGHVVAALRSVGVDARSVPMQALDPALFDDLLAGGVTRVFNLVEGIEGDASREHEFAAAVRHRGLAATGSPPEALYLASRKHEAREVLAAAGLPVPAGLVVSRVADLPHFAEADYPRFVKPAIADGSIGIDQGSVVSDRLALERRVAWTLEHLGPPCLVEAWLPGVEINVAILPPGLPVRAAATAIDASALPGDLRPIVTYAAKWRPESPEYVLRSVPAAQLVPPPVLRTATRLGLAAFAALGLRGYGRVDMRCDAAGRPHIIDINPNPDLHPEAGFSLAAASVGVPWTRLIYAITDSARVWRDREHSPGAGRRSAATRRPAPTHRGVHT